MSIIEFVYKIKRKTNREDVTFSSTSSLRKNLNLAISIGKY